MNPDELIRLCRDCAGMVYGTRPPTGRYAESVARLLAGTAAAESLLKWRRQMHFSDTNPEGAWGLWQTEKGAVADSVKYLRRRLDVQAAALRFAPTAAPMLAFTDELPRLHLIRDDDRVACLFARLHYLRVSESVPEGLEEQARYWKRYYNTAGGKGTVPEYLAKYRRLVAPAL